MSDKMSKSQRSKIVDIRKKFYVWKQEAEALVKELYESDPEGYSAYVLSNTIGNNSLTMESSLLWAERGEDFENA